MSTTATVAEILRLAEGEDGYQESRSGGHWTNHEKYAAQVPGLAWVSTDGEPWCVVFNCWLDYKAGLKPDVDFPLTASCDAAAAWFKKAGRWSDKPGIGAWVLFGTASDLVHTGRVVAYNADTITVTAGNTSTTGSREGDGVHTLTYQRRSAYVVGYGYPRNLAGIKSADPKFNEKPVPPPAPKPTPARVDAQAALPSLRKARKTVGAKTVKGRGLTQMINDLLAWRPRRRK